MPKPDDAPARDGGEPFLSRWSRKKEEARGDPPPAKREADPKAPPPELPPVESLTPDSDYRPFLHPKVDEDVRRSALKKLFSDPHFNVMDGLDVYIDDYSKTEPIPPEMMATLRQAQNIFEWARQDKEELARKDARLAEEKRAAFGPPAAETPDAGTKALDATPVVPAPPAKDA